MIDLTFCKKINIKGFYNLIPLFLLAIASHAQTTQNNKFSISLQYFEKKRGNEIDFSHEDKHQTFLEVNFIHFGAHDSPI